MELLQQFSNYIIKNVLFPKGAPLLIAVSGGVDSVVLCELCHRANYSFKIAHCNFQLRGEESERDEKLVRELAASYNVEFFSKRFDTQKIADERKTGIQETARELRYFWFLELWGQEFEQNKQRYYILTAHHANDNIETLLMNFFKGTGINGLKGIRPKEQNHLIRPLLFATKEALREFAVQNNLKYAEDSSNESDKYTRNYFRNQLIPSIQKVFPNAEENLIHNLERFKDIQVLYKQAIAAHIKKLVQSNGKEILIPVAKLLQSEPLNTIVYEIIKKYDFTPHQADDVISLLHAESGKYVQSPSHRIIRNRKFLIITSAKAIASEHIVIQEEEKVIDFLEGTIKMEKLILSTNYKLQTTNDIALLNAKEITYPLLLRRWKQGDYFYPLGMKKKKKKLGKFFIDQKLSIADKENVWILESDKKIIWILGMRIDERFKITDATKEALRIEFNKL